MQLILYVLGVVLGAALSAVVFWLRIERRWKEKTRALAAARLAIDLLRNQARKDRQAARERADEKPAWVPLVLEAGDIDRRLEMLRALRGGIDSLAPADFPGLGEVSDAVVDIEGFLTTLREAVYRPGRSAQDDVARAGGPGEAGDATEAGIGGMRVFAPLNARWVDIEGEPQVEYLAPASTQTEFAQSEHQMQKLKMERAASMGQQELFTHLAAGSSPASCPIEASR